MMNYTGGVVSMALGLGLAVTASSMTPQAMQSMFSGTVEGSQAAASTGIAIREFIGGLHLAFWISVGLSLIAAVISLLRGPARTRSGDGKKAGRDTPLPS